MTAATNNPLTPASVKITLAGETFRWTELPRRQAREAAVHIAEINDLLLQSDRDLGAFFKACNRILDFFYEFHPKMNVLRSTVEKAEEDQILLAYREVQRLILSPLTEAVGRIRNAPGLNEASSENEAEPTP